MGQTNNLNNWTLWIDGRRIHGAQEYTPPDMKITRVDVKTAGMDVARPVDGGMEPMTATFKIYGIDEDVLRLFGMQTGQKMPRITAYSAYVATGQTIDHRDEIEGMIISITPDARAKDGQTDAGFQIEVAVSYYRSVLNGREVYEIIPELFVRRVNGVNVLSDIASAIRV